MMGKHDFPVLETRRPALKAPRPDGFPNFQATFIDNLSPVVCGSLKTNESWMLYAVETGHCRGFGMWMIHDKQIDATFGMAGGWQPAGWWECEIALAIWPDRDGKGFAMEASNAARQGYSRAGWDGAVSYIAPNNLDPIRLAERHGATKDHGPWGDHNRRQRRGLPPPGARHFRRFPTRSWHRNGNRALRGFTLQTERMGP